VLVEQGLELRSPGTVVAHRHLLGRIASDRLVDRSRYIASVRDETTPDKVLLSRERAALG